MVRVVTHRSARAGPRRSPLARSLWYAAELLVTLGLVLLLLVVHQLWWTNRQARAAALHKAEEMERAWGRVPGSREGPVSAPDRRAAPAPDPARRSAPDPARRPAPAPDRPYAVLRIPRLSLRTPVAEGISKSGVLNKGYAGHYPRTAQPGRPGNVGLAGHRNTHGEPFRHLDRLRPGDRLVLVTREATYTYAVDQVLPRTSARDGGVLKPVPRSDVKAGYGYRTAGHYLTLTTCTPAHTSKYRLVVWGKLRSTTPR
ncbi:class E sortase [Streptomyces spectabilis]|uniref:class E sortase n=1 Tax=Streptomyces spectabilis TaxID=68270 RepID=UPI001CEFAE4C|nr:class E sortase [Streptomyces spectabilis]